MNQIAKNRYLDAFLKVLLILAIVHFFTLLVFSIINKDYQLLNTFRILNLELVHPILIHGVVSTIIGTLISIGLYLIVFFFFTKTKK